MVAGEGNRHQDNVGLPSLDVLLDRISRLGPEPCRRSDLRLPAEAVWVAVVQSLHHRMNSGSDLGWVWITCETC